MTPPEDLNLRLEDIESRLTKLESAGGSSAPPATGGDEQEPEAISRTEAIVTALSNYGIHVDGVEGLPPANGTGTDTGTDTVQQ